MYAFFTYIKNGFNYIYNYLFGNSKTSDHVEVNGSNVKKVPTQVMSTHLNELADSTAPCVKQNVRAEPKKESDLGAQLAPNSMTLPEPADLLQASPLSQTKDLKDLLPVVKVLPTIIDDKADMAKLTLKEVQADPISSPPLVELQHAAELPPASESQMKFKLETQLPSPTAPEVELKIQSPSGLIKSETYEIHGTSQLPRPPVFNSQVAPRSDSRSIHHFRNTAKFHPKTPLLTPVYTPQKGWHQVRLPQQRGRRSSPAINFFTPVPLLSLDIGCYFISRKQLPRTLIRLLNELKKVFPWARIYLTGAGPENILNGIKPNDYDLLIIGPSLDMVDKYLKTKPINSSVRSFKYPIIHCELGNNVLIDFTVKSNDYGEPFNNLLARDYMVRDFNASSLYCEFTQNNKFWVFSFNKALQKLQEGIIDSNLAPMFTFTQDPTRLFRLIKIMICKPNHKLGDFLAKTIKDLSDIQDSKPKWAFLFNQFIKMEYGNLDRFNQAIRKLFLRYNYQAINPTLHQLGLLASFTDNASQDVERACAKIPNIKTENKFIFWILANMLMGLENGKEFAHCPLAQFLKLSPEENAYFNRINGKKAGQITGLKDVPKELTDLINQFNLTDEVTQTPKLATVIATGCC